MFSATFNNISVTWRKPSTYHLQTLSHNVKWSTVKPALVTTSIKLVKPALVTTSIKLVKPALVTTSIKL